MQSFWHAQAQYLQQLCPVLRHCHQLPTCISSSPHLPTTQAGRPLSGGGDDRPQGAGGARRTRVSRLLLKPCPVWFCWPAQEIDRPPLRQCAALRSVALNPPLGVAPSSRNSNSCLFHLHRSRRGVYTLRAKSEGSEMDSLNIRERQEFMNVRRRPCAGRGGWVGQGGWVGL